MGDYADMVLEGIMCEGCGLFISFTGNGYPEKCDDCKKEDEETHLND